MQLIRLMFANPNTPQQVDGPDYVSGNAFRGATAYAADLAREVERLKLSNFMLHKQAERRNALLQERGQMIHRLQGAISRRNAMLDAVEGECEALRGTLRAARAVGAYFSRRTRENGSAARVWFGEFKSALKIVNLARTLVTGLSGLGPDEALPASTRHLAAAASVALTDYMDAKEALIETA